MTGDRGLPERNSPAPRAVYLAITLWTCIAMFGCGLAANRALPGTPIVAQMAAPATTPPGEKLARPELDLDSVGTPPDPAASVPLPAVFVGCWVGTVETPDSVKRTRFMAFLGTLPPTTYHICYRLDANTKNGKMILRQMASPYSKGFRITQFDNQVVWSNGRDTGFLRNHIATVGPVWFPFTHTRGDVYADELITIRNPNVLRMRGVEVIQVSGKDYIRVVFHTNFHRDLATSQTP
jgi:hypothetical protein